MYSSIQVDITTSDLSEIIYYVIKVLNKFKSHETSEINFSELPNLPRPENLMIANNLLGELDIRSIKGNNTLIDTHIYSLFKILNERVQSENTSRKEDGISILARFRKTRD